MTTANEDGQGAPPTFIVGPFDNGFKRLRILSENPPFRNALHDVRQLKWLPTSCGYSDNGDDDDVTYAIQFQSHSTITYNYFVSTL